MSQENQYLKQAFSLFPSILILVLATFILNVAYDSAFMQGLGVLGWALLFLMRIFLYSGFYGQIMDIVSGQEITVSLTNITANAKRFWFAYIMISLIPFVLHFFITAFSDLYAESSVGILNSHFQMVLLYLLCVYMIYSKYLKKHNISIRNQRMTGRVFLTLIILYLLDVSLFYLPILSDFHFGEIQNVAGFFKESVRYFQFIFLSVLMIAQYPEIKERYEAKDNKELYLINPLGGGVFDSFGSLVIKINPASLLVLKALTPPEYKIRVFNQYLWRKRYFKRNVLVAITCYTVNSYRAYKIAKGFRALGAKVVMGGSHVSCIPQEALEYCDSVVIGEAEAVWREVISDYEHGCLKKKYYGGKKDVFCEEVQRAILNSPPEEMKDYLETTRGCKYACDFCSVPYLCGGKIRHRPIAHMVAMIKKLKFKYKKISFIDDNIYSNPSYARELFKAMKPLNIKWIAGCSIDIVKNKEDFDLAIESGCVGLMFGYEIIAGSKEQLKGGKYSLADQYIEYSRAAKKRAIDIKGGFIIGWDEDSWSSLLKLLLFSFRVYPQIAIVNVLTPLPSSRLYNRLLREKRLTNLNWRKFTFNGLVFKHPHLNRYWLEKAFYLYQPVFSLVTSGMGNLYLVILIYVFLLPFLIRSIMLLF